MKYELIDLQESEFETEDFEHEIKLGDFGYFVLSKEAVYILDGSGIIAFNENLDEIWRNHSLAIDGVTFQEMLGDEIMSISCEMDPPGGWVNRKINVKTGKLCDKHIGSVFIEKGRIAV